MASDLGHRQAVSWDADHEILSPHEEFSYLHRLDWREHTGMEVLDGSCCCLTFLILVNSVLSL